MAKRSITTRPGAMEPPTHFTHTPISRAFSQLAGALGCYVEAERDIEHSSWADPALEDWSTDEEEARLDVLEGMADVLELQIERPSDQPLRLTALLGRAMLESTRPDDFIQLHGLFDRHADCFRCPGDDPVSLRIDRMLVTARAHLDAVAALSGDGASGPTDPELPPMHG
ncbi:hypothetical protein [Rhodobacter sp. NSM]|uniref:hypothetical protein n=1 Tax=Rhodobacter sp. NSM TaxID=3457501 RepID=UPI003FD20996